MVLLTALKQVNWTDLAKRAAWTFAQAFVAVFVLAGDAMFDTLMVGDWQSLSVLLIATTLSAVAAGLSALKSVVLDIRNQFKPE